MKYSNYSTSVDERSHILADIPGKKPSFLVSVEEALLVLPGEYERNYVGVQPKMDLKGAMAIMYHGCLSNLNQAKYVNLVDGYAKVKDNIKRENVTEMVKSAVYSKENYFIK